MSDENGEWQYGILSEFGWIHEPRGENYALQRRWASYGTPEWVHDGSPVTEVATFQRPVGVADIPEGEQ